MKRTLLLLSCWIVWGCTQPKLQDEFSNDSPSTEGTNANNGTPASSQNPKKPGAMAAGSGPRRNASSELDGGMQGDTNDEDAGVLATPSRPPSATGPEPRPGPVEPTPRTDPTQAGAGGGAPLSPTTPGAPSAGAPAPAVPALEGTWLGRVADIAGVSFNLCMTITQARDAGPAGTTKYFGSNINCGGEIEFIDSDGDVFNFSERITSGRGCIPAGRMEVRVRASGALDWEWFSVGASVPRETSSMERVDACP